jgi:sulfate transport system permease protein
MAGGAPALARRGRSRGRASAAEPASVRWVLSIVAFVFLTLFLFLPIATVFVEAFRDGVGAYFAAITEPDTLSAIGLTLRTAAIAVPLNALFGVAAAWVIARFRFRGRNVLITLIDLPFAVSPVIAGMVFVLLFGAQGLLGPLLGALGTKVIFAEPGIYLATTFVTFPFVARELIPFLQSQGSEEDRAALVLGASGWQMFFRVTLPNAKWGLLYGIVLCNARAMGEFGAVSVVSGHVRGRTNTVPLHVEALYSEYKFSSAFAVASLLVMLGLLTLAAKHAIERRAERERERAEEEEEAAAAAAALPEAAE